MICSINSLLLSSPLFSSSPLSPSPLPECGGQNYGLWHPDLNTCVAIPTFHTPFSSRIFRGRILSEEEPLSVSLEDITTNYPRVEMDVLYPQMPDRMPVTTAAFEQAMMMQSSTVTNVVQGKFFEFEKCTLQNAIEMKTNR